MKRGRFVGSAVAAIAAMAVPFKAPAMARFVIAPTPVVAMSLREGLKASGLSWEAALARSLRCEVTEVAEGVRNDAWAAINDPIRMAAAEARAKEYAAYKTAHA